MNAFQVELVNLGCRVNRVETDLIALELERSGATLSSHDASVVVINTCAVTGEAEAKTRKAVRRALAEPQKPWVVATGCAAALFSDELSSLSERVICERDKIKVAPLVLELLGVGNEAPKTKPSRISATPTGRMRPGIKIQDGCDNRCSFCIVWKARGQSHSYEIDEVFTQVEEALSRGAQELVLTGINVGSYRSSFGERTLDLPDLMELILEHYPVTRLRIASIEPNDVDEKLLTLIASSKGRIAPYLHICLQSGSDKILSRMARTYSTQDFEQRVELAKSLIEDISLGTDLIVGFPGESDADFQDSLAFCERMGFSRMHIFSYSLRPGTPAALMPDQVSPVVKNERSRKAHELALRMRKNVAATLINTPQLLIPQSEHKGMIGAFYELETHEHLSVKESYIASCDSVTAEGELLGHIVKSLGT